MDLQLDLHHAKGRNGSRSCESANTQHWKDMPVQVSDELATRVQLIKKQLSHLMKKRRARVKSLMVAVSSISGQSNINLSMLA